MEENGFDVAGFRRSKICVSPHRNPEKKAADITRMKPMVENDTSPATMRRTPTVMVAMMPTSRMEGVSSRNTNANSNTKAREDDLHIV